MQQIVLIILAIFFGINCYSQGGYIATYDYNSFADTGGNIEVDEFGNMYLYGQTNVNSNFRPYVLFTTNESGQLNKDTIHYKDSVKYYSGFGQYLSKHGNNLIFTGAKDSAAIGTTVPILRMFDFEGIVLFEKSYYSPFWRSFNCVKPNYNSLLIGGDEDISTSGGTNNMYLIKTDLNGNIIWEKDYGGNQNENIYSVDTMADGGILLGGYTNSYGEGKFDVYLVKTDSLGIMEWDTTFGGPESDVGFSMATTDGGAMAFGYIRNYQGIYYDAFLGKLKGDGTMQWYKEFGNPLDHNDYFTDGLEVLDGYLFCGSTYDETNSFPVGWLLKVDFDGNEVWSHTYQIRDNDHYLQDIESTPDGGFVMSGYVFADGSETGDLWIVKVDSTGCVQDSCLLTGINELPFGSAQGTMQIYPNPNNGSFVVSLSEKRWLSEAEVPNVKASGQINIYSTTGRLLHQENIVMAKQQVRVKAPAGVYFVEYVNELGAVLREKMIVE